VYTIIEGAANSDLAGKLMALHGCRVSCGAQVLAVQQHLISDSRLISKGSQFGHTAIEMDGTVYGRAPSAWDVDSRINYLKRQSYRDTWGYKLIVKSEEKSSILAFIQKQRAQNKGYDILINSCSSNTADALGAAGLIVHDPRFSPFTVSPKDLEVGLKHSKRLVDTATYPKK
jgi:hypothetical protein